MITHSVRTSTLTSCVAAIVLAAAGAAHSQEYPTRPIRVILPFPAGGGSDIVARVTSQKLGALLGQPAIVDNRAGASGNIAADLVAKAPADGYTILFGNSSLSISPAVFHKLSYDPVRDLVPISMVSSYPFVLVAHPSLPVRNVRELVALAKTKPGALAYSSAGAGTMSHFAMELMRLRTGISVNHLPYKGAAPASIAVISGEAQVAFLVLPVAQTQIKAGKLRGLAVAAPSRAAVIAQVPTMREAGVADNEALQWNGFFAPARTPQAVLDRLQRETVKALSDPEVRSRFEAEGATPVGSTPSEFASFFKVEARKWGEVAQKSGTKLD